MISAFAAALPVLPGYGDEETLGPLKRTDAEVAIAYALAVLRETARKPMEGRVPIGKLDVRQPSLLEEATDADDRTYVFVAFGLGGNPDSGFFVTFELCPGRLAEYSPRYAGFTARLADELKEFLAVTGDPSRQFPGECKYWIP